MYCYFITCDVQRIWKVLFSMAHFHKLNDENKGDYINTQKLSYSMKTLIKYILIKASITSKIIIKHEFWQAGRMSFKWRIFYNRECTDMINV